MSPKEVNKTNSKLKVGKTKTVELTLTLDLQDGDKMIIHINKENSNL